MTQKIEIYRLIGKYEGLSYFNKETGTYDGEWYVIADRTFDKVEKQAVPMHIVESYVKSKKINL